MFELDNAGRYTVLYSFGTNQSGDGANPTGGLIQDAAGNLYGATSAGGAPDDFYGQKGDGTVFEVDTTGQETALYDFCLDFVGSGSCPDGAVPNGGLALQKAAVNLYGVTTYGGCGPFDDADCAGFGTVFSALAGGYDEWTFYRFCSAANCTDGANPNGPLIEDAADNLYGTQLTAAPTILLKAARARYSSWTTRVMRRCSTASVGCELHGRGAAPRGPDPGRCGQPLRHHGSRRCQRRRHGVRADAVVSNYNCALVFAEPVRSWAGGDV